MIIERNNYTYAVSEYCSNHTLALIAYQKGIEITEDTAPEAVVTINLEEYCMEPGHDEIFMPAYKLPADMCQQFLEDLQDRRRGQAPKLFNIGPYDAPVYRVKLDPGIAALIKIERLKAEIEQYKQEHSRKGSQSWQ